MTDATAQMLEDLPDNLAARGWAFVRLESKVAKRRFATSHVDVAVYERPYHAPVDHLATALTVLHGKVYVSTAQTQSLTWAAACEEAITLMRSIDAPRLLGADAAP